jgi:hypothetical protein
MFCRQREIVIRGNENEIESNAKLCNERIYRPDLDSCAPASVAQFGGTNVIVAIWDQHWQSGKFLDQLPVGLWTCKALQQLLQNKPRGDDGVASLKRSAQGLDLRRR